MAARQKPQSLRLSWSEKEGISRSHQNAIYQDMSVPQIVEKILRERHGLRGQDFLFSLVSEYPRREQVVHFLPCNQVKVTTVCQGYGTPGYPINEPMNMKEPAQCPE